MTSSTERYPRVRLALAGVVFIAVLSCAPEGAPSGASPAVAPLAAGLGVDALDAGVGDTIRVTIIGAVSGDEPLAALQGRVRYDPRALRFLGQPLMGSVLHLVNADGADRGELRVISLRLAGLDRLTADLRFEVLRSDYARGLRYELEVATTARLLTFAHADALPLAMVPTAPDPTGTEMRLLTIEDWWRLFGLQPVVRVNVPGAGAIYGDAYTDGSINGLDASIIANVAVGNRQLLTEVPRDNAIAGNVYPFNLPGLGEAGDATPPGQNPDGSFTINALDAVVIANESVGNDQPVAGEPIPGRTPRPFQAVLSGLLASSRTLYRDTVYELQGNVIVGPGATLTIQPGTQLEGDPATRGALIVARAGNIDWRGTRLEPIVFTCKGASKVPGCWGGVVLNGLALLNNRDPGVTGFCPEKISIGSSELYGGCLVEDTTGVMRYVRIEYGGMGVSAGGTAPGLALLGIGTGTVLDQVQVHGSLGDGIYLSGGNVNLRHLVLSGNFGASLHWDHGWGGNAFGGSVQFVQIQVPQGGGDAILGSNLAGNPDAGPRSEPDLYNVTVVGAGTGNGAGRGFVLQDGSSGTLRSAIVLQTSGSGFDVQGTTSCGQFSGGFAFLDHDIFFGNTPDFAADADCFDEAAYATTPALQNRVTSPGLNAATNTLTPDTRPLPGSAATTGNAVPPSNLFFDLLATYIGAVEPADMTGTNIPWYAGWTRGWSGPNP
jgi:hypothetical protein